MTTTPPTATPSTLEGRLAVSLRTAVEALNATYADAGAALLDHARPLLRGETLVPDVLTAALDVVHDLEEHATNPPENLRTRARLAEQLQFRASIVAVVVDQTAAALTMAPMPPDLAAAVDEVCAEVVRLEEHAAAFDGITYDTDDEAGEAAAVMAAQVRGEVIGARRGLAILLGILEGEPVDGGYTEAYVAAWRKAGTPAPAAGPAGPRLHPGDPAAAYATRQAETVTPLWSLLHTIIKHTPGTPWSTGPLFITEVGDLFAPLGLGEAQQIADHSAVVVPVLYAGAPPAGGRVPDAALDALEEIVAAAAMAASGPRVVPVERLADFLELHAWDDEGGVWQVKQ